jgi:hypothetical protein
MKNLYILDGHVPVICNDLMKWAQWSKTADRTVAKTILKNCRVSTVFLTINHNFEQDGEPVLFETMVFGGKHDQKMERYSTWEEAEKGHKRMVKQVS